MLIRIIVTRITGVDYSLLRRSDFIGTSRKLSFRTLFKMLLDYRERNLSSSLQGNCSQSESNYAGLLYSLSTTINKLITSIKEMWKYF